MKTNQIILGILIWAITPVLINGQPNSIVKEFHTSVKGVYRTDGPLSSDAKAKNLSPDNRIAITNAILKDGDLRINFQLAKSLKREKKLLFLFQPYLTSARGELMDVHPKHLEGDFQLDYSSKDRMSQLKWLDFSENFDWGSDEFELHLRGELRGPLPVNCNEEPAFGIRQQLPHYLLAGLSAGMVVTGYSLKSSSEDLYDQYRDAVFRGPEDGANSLYNKSNIRNKNSEFFKIAGYGAFAANAIVYLVRYASYKSNLKAYQYYCSDKQLKLEPTLELSSGGTNAGMKINYRF